MPIDVTQVTASLTASFELAPMEAWLVRKLETQEELKKRERCAIAVMQATARVWVVVRARSKQSRSKMHRPSSAHLLTAADERVTRCRRVRDEAVAAFRLARKQAAHLTHVHTLAVLHTSMDGLRVDQQRLGSEQTRLGAKMDAVLKVLAETTKSVQAVHRCVDAKGEAERGGTPGAVKLRTTMDGITEAEEVSPLGDDARAPKRLVPQPLS